MATQRIEIDTDILNSDIQEILLSITNIQNNLKNMFDEVSAMNSMWKGQANQAYNAQFQADYETMNGIIEELLEYGEALQDAKTSYDRCENEVESIVRSIYI